MGHIQLVIVCWIVLPLLTGCAPRHKFAEAGAEWTTYTSDNQALRFEHPADMKLTVKSRQPMGFMLEDARSDFTIIVVHRENSHCDDDYVREMIDVSRQDCETIGEAEPIILGDARGQRLDYSMRDGYKTFLGRTTVLVTESDGVVIQVCYSKLFEDRLKPIYERVINSLSFDCATLEPKHDLVEIEISVSA